ncbi:unnamed protein product, partial [Nesidiocoris tenuis]
MKNDRNLFLEGVVVEYLKFQPRKPQVGAVCPKRRPKISSVPLQRGDIRFSAERRQYMTRSDRRGHTTTSDPTQAVGAPPGGRVYWHLASFARHEPGGLSLAYFRTRYLSRTQHWCKVTPRAYAGFRASAAGCDSGS